MIAPSNKALSWTLLIILSVIWGSSFILIHEGLKVYTPTQVASLRISVAGLIFLPFAILRISKVKRQDIKWFALAGLIGNFLPAFLFANAQTHVNSSTAGALNSLTPFFTLIAGVLLFSKKFNKYKFLGILLGFIGALSLIINKPDGGIESNYLYGILIVIATLLYGTNVNIIENKLKGYKPMSIAAIPLGIVGIPSLILAHLYEFPVSSMFNEHYSAGSLSIIGLGIAGTAVSLVLFNRLIQISSGLFASTVTYLMPVVSTIWGIYFLEPFGVIQTLSLSLILVGVVILRNK